MSSSLSFPVVLKFSFSTRTNYREANAVLDKSASGFAVKTRNGVFSTVPSWVNYELAKMKTYSLNDAECYSMCTFHELRDKSKRWRDGTELMDLLGANNKVLPSIKAAGRKRLLSAVSEMDATEGEDDPADSDYVPSDSDEAEDDHEFDENVVSEPEDDEPGSEPEDDVLTDGDYESDPEENLRFIAKKVVTRAKAKRAAAAPKPVSMKRTDLMTAAEFQEKINALVTKVAKRATEGPSNPGLMAPRRSAAAAAAAAAPARSRPSNVCARNPCRTRAPYNSPMLSGSASIPTATPTLNADDMLVVEALLNLKSNKRGGARQHGPRMEIIEEMPLELPPAAAASATATGPRRSNRIANKNSH